MPSESSQTQTKRLAVTWGAFASLALVTMGAGYLVEIYLWEPAGGAKPD